MSRGGWMIFIVCVLVASLLWWRAGAPRGTTVEDGPPSVILISLDTLRWDAVAAVAGAVPSLTPHLDRFARDAVILRGAFVQMPFTLPSHMTALTGLRPAAHGVGRDGDRLSPNIPTLTEMLAAEGYGTVGLVTNDWLKGDFGFSRGFDVYERLPHDLTYAPRVTAVAGRLDLAPPFFLFLHFMDPHSDFYQVRRNRLPYYAPPAFRPRPAPDAPSDDVRFCDEQTRCATAYLLAADVEHREIDDAELSRIRQLYEAGVRYLDRDLGRLFAILRAREMYDDALIIVTSDHGEEFREHGRFIHSQPYDETIRVPMLIKLPRSRLGGTARDGLVEMTDLTPTILDLLDLPVPDHLQGTSFLPLLETGRPVRRMIVSQDQFERSRWALRTARHKLIWDEDSDDSELYALGADPLELDNVSEDRPELTALLRRHLSALVEEDRRLHARLSRGRPGDDASESVLSEEERRRLRSLGYFGS